MKYILIIILCLWAFAVASTFKAHQQKTKELKNRIDSLILETNQWVEEYRIHLAANDSIIKELTKQ